MVVDRAENCVYDIFATPDEVFDLIFTPGTDIAFIEDIEQRQDADQVFETLHTIWSNRLPKNQAMGIHGMLFYQLYNKRQYYPTLRDEEAINPNGSRLR